MRARSDLIRLRCCLRLFIALWLLCLAAPAFAQAQAQAAEGPVWSGVARVVAVGDVHGDHDKFVAVLRRCGVLDGKGRWAGGRTHLVQTGDVLDRGPDSRKTMDLLMKLEGEARRAGGRVHALIGNHEAMNVLGDLRYVADGEFTAFGDPPRGTPVGEEPRGAFPGHRAAFAPGGTYGRWILGHNAVVKIDGTIFLHGGLSPRYAGRDLRELNEAVRRELAAGGDPRGGIVGDPDGPLWYRGLALGDPEALRGEVEAVLAAQKARRIVMGHSIQEDGISLRLDGRLALIDVGMSRWTRDRQPSCLLIERAGPAADRVKVLR